MELKSVATYTIRLAMAGDIESAKRWLRSEFWERGCCVTISPTLFLYTAGEEVGFEIGFVNYPRFPIEPRELLEKSRQIATNLMVACCQRTCLLIADDVTEWLSCNAPGAS